MKDRSHGGKAKDGEKPIDGGRKGEVHAQSETVKPEAAKPDGTMPDGATPDSTKPDGTNAEAKPAASDMTPAADGDPDFIPITNALDSHEKLRSLARIYNGMVKRGELGILPKDINGVVIKEHLLAHIGSLARRQSAGSMQKEAVVSVKVDARTARQALSRYESLVDSHFPLGSEGRSDFFTVGIKDPSVGQSLAAMVAGIHKHGISEGLPIEFPLAVVEEMVANLPAQAEARKQAGDAVGAVSVAGGNLGARTRKIRRRVVSLLHGRYGRTSEKLTAYSLKPRSERGGRRPRGKPKAPPTTPPIPKGT